ncbi:MAG: CFI-box-CTERM domain-containing protein, partial [Pseudomonadota bacterium]
PDGRPCWRGLRSGEWRADAAVRRGVITNMVTAGVRYRYTEPGPLSLSVSEAPAQSEINSLAFALSGAADPAVLNWDSLKRGYVAVIAFDTGPALVSTPFRLTTAGSQIARGGPDSIPGLLAAMRRSGGMTIHLHRADIEPDRSSVGDAYALRARRDRVFSQAINLEGFAALAARAPAALAAAEADHRRGRCEEIPSSCYLTTACVDMLGLGDRCWELQALRRFRDRVMARTPEGRALIERYYRGAPGVVARIAARPDARAQYARLYAGYILPAALAAELGCARFAERRYTAMVRRVARLTGVEALAS